MTRLQNQHVPYQNNILPVLRAKQVTLAIMGNFVIKPDTTLPSPAVIASNPVWFTIARSFFARPLVVAASRNSVLVAPQWPTLSPQKGEARIEYVIPIGKSVDKIIERMWPRGMVSLECKTSFVTSRYGSKLILREAHLQPEASHFLRGAQKALPDASQDDDSMQYILDQLRFLQF